MPYISVDVTCLLTNVEKQEIASKMGKVMEQIPGKDHSRLMVAVRDNVFLTLASVQENLAYFNVMIYGTTTFEAKKNFTEAAYEALHSVTNIPCNKMYLNFTETDIWGIDGTLK